VFIKKTIDKGYVIVCLYMNDMLISVSNGFMIKYTKKILTSKYDMKVSGVANVILGIKFCRTSNGFVLSQSHYGEKHS